MLRDEILAEIPNIKSNISGQDADGINISDLKFGLAGSVANNKIRKNSDIDIVVDSNGFSIENMEYIKQYLKEKFNRKVDILFLPLLKNEDDELDQIAIKFNLPINMDSVYKTVNREVIWYGK
jgi:predicted nucleotidyltransferase